MDDTEREVAERSKVYVKVLAGTFLVGIPIAAAALPFTDAETLGITIGVFATGFAAVTASRLVVSLRFLPPRARFSLLLLLNMASTTVAIYLGGTQAYPLAALYALGVMVESSAKDARRVMLTAAVSWILFSLAVLARHGGHFVPGTYLPVFFMAFVMALTLILGSLSSQAERDLRARLTETVSNLRRVKTTPCRWAGRSISLTVSLGVALYPSHATDRRSLLRMADQGLLLAKQERDKVVVAGLEHS